MSILTMMLLLMITVLAMIVTVFFGVIDSVANIFVNFGCIIND